MGNSTAKKTPKVSFYQVVLSGSPKLICGFLNGLMMGSGRKGSAFFCHDEGVDHESVVKRLAEMVHLHPADCHVIVDGGTRDYLKKLAPRMEKNMGLKLLSSRYIRSATLPFGFVAYAKRYGVEIMGLLNALPEGVRLKEFESEEKVDPDARGVEAYAPVHDYEIRGQGDIVGRVDLVIDTRRTLDMHPLVEVEKIKLSLA